jgi:hypothetical protein
MWTETTRAQHARADLALPSDLTDDEWALLEPFFPPASHVGRPRKWPLRRIVEAILYLLRGAAVANAAAMLSAGLNGAALVLPLAGQQAAVVIEPYPALDRSRAIILTCDRAGLARSA